MQTPCITQGFVLHHRDYSNTSKIVYCLTKDFGLIHLIAKGAKNSKSAFFADCQPFRLIELQFIKKPGLSILTASNTVSLIQFTETAKQFSGFYINELLYRLIKTDYQDSALFMLYLTTMDELLDGENLEFILRTFEYNLLTNLGYDFQQHILNMQFSDDCYYQLNMPNMVFTEIDEKMIANNNTQSNNLNRQGVDVFEGKFLQSISDLTAQNFQQFKKQHKQFCRLVFHYLLDGRPLKSRELFASLNG